jgi:hypothetical protein
MPSRGIRIPCAGRSTVWHRFARTCIRGTPLCDEAQRPYRSHLPRSRNPTIALTVDALAAARRGRNGAYYYVSIPFPSLLTLLPDVLGIVSSTRFSWIRFCASLRACSPATRRAHTAEIVVCLKRTSTASTTTPRYRAQLRATLPSHSSMFHRVHRTSP